MPAHPPRSFTTPSTWLAGAAVALAVFATQGVMAAADPYADPANPALPKVGMKKDLPRTALVVIDPQVDFLSPKGKAWKVVGNNVTETRIVPNLLRLFAASKQAGITVAISPHYYYPHDHTWKFQGPAEAFQHELGIFDRKGALTLDGMRGSGADFLPEFKPYIEDGKTIVASTHKLYSPEVNDLVLQLRKQRVEKIILAGMLSNLCVESHLRHFLEQGFEVVVVRDAIAGPQTPEGDGYLSALINIRYMAHGLWTTDEVLAKLL